MKTLEFKVSITIPDNINIDYNYLQDVLYNEFDGSIIENKWKIKVEEV